MLELFLGSRNTILRRLVQRRPAAAGSAGTALTELLGVFRRTALACAAIFLPPPSITEGDAGGGCHSLLSMQLSDSALDGMADLPTSQIQAALQRWTDSAVKEFGPWCEQQLLCVTSCEELGRVQLVGRQPSAA